MSGPTQEFCEEVYKAKRRVDLEKDGRNFRGKQFVIAVKVFQGKPFVDLRNWLLGNEKAEGDPWTPTKQGVVVYLDELASVIEALTNAKAIVDRYLQLHPEILNRRKPEMHDPRLQHKHPRVPRSAEEERVSRAAAYAEAHRVAVDVREEERKREEAKHTEDGWPRDKDGLIPGIKTTAYREHVAEREAREHLEKEGLGEVDKDLDTPF